MNPLSAHPPRTPRSSVISSQRDLYGVPVYEPTEHSEPSPESVESDDEEEVDALAEAEGKVRHEQVLREMVLTSNGRDKAFVRSRLLCL
jgi:hypothetical protein